MKTLLFIKIYCYTEVFFNPHVPPFFEAKVLREVRILRNLHNNSTMLMSKFQNKSSYIIIAKFFEVILFFDYVFYSLSICECSKKIL